jgi:RpiR family carbohydrate utilization transcriptional regulator
MISSIYEIVSTHERPVNMNMLEKIQFQLEHLSKSERKVAEVILASPLRRFIQASPLWHRKRASANRRSTAFCRSLETRGFPDFKLHLAQSLANGTPYVNRNVDEDDSVDAYTAKILSRRWQRLTTSASRWI